MTHSLKHVNEWDRLQKEGASTRKIAKQYGVTKGAVSGALFRLRNPGQAHFWKAARNAVSRERAKSDRAAELQSRKDQLSLLSVRTPGKVRQMAALYADGVKFNEIGRQFGITRQAVSLCIKHWQRKGAEEREHAGNFAIKASLAILQLFKFAAELPRCEYGHAYPPLKPRRKGAEGKPNPHPHPRPRICRQCRIQSADLAAEKHRYANAGFSNTGTKNAADWADYWDVRILNDACRRGPQKTAEHFGLEVATVSALLGEYA